MPSHCSVVVYFWQLCSMACSHCSVVVYFWQLSHVLWLGGFCDMLRMGGWCMPSHCSVVVNFWQLCSIYGMFTLFCGCLFLAVIACSVVGWFL